MEILLYAFDKIHGHRRLHYANFQALELCHFSLVSVIKNERIYVDTHSCQKYIYKHIYVFIYNKEKWLNFIYLKIRPFSTQLRIYTALRWKRGEKKKKTKKLKSVNTQIFPLTRCPFSASLHFTSDFIFKLWASDNSAQFFFPPRGRSSLCLLGKKLLMNILSQEGSQ